MKIGALAKRLGMATSKIRFYESAGLLGTVTRQDNGFRAYDERAILRLSFIRDAQRAGLGLEAIRALLPKETPTPRSASAQQRLLKELQNRLAAIEAVQQQLRVQRSELKAAMDQLRAQLTTDTEAESHKQQSLL